MDGVSQAINKNAIFLIVLLGFLQGATFLFLKIAVTFLNPFTIVLLRLLLALPFLYVYIAIKRLPLISVFKANWKNFLLLSLSLMVIPFSLITWASRLIPSGVASVYMAFIPIIVAVLEVLFKGNVKFKPSAYIGLVLGIIGVGLLSSGDIRAHGFGNVSGHIMCIIAVSFFAFALFKSKVLSAVPPMITSFYVMAFGSLILLPFVMVNETWVFEANALQWFSIFGLAVLSTAVTYWLFYYLIERVGTVLTAATNYLVPLVGIGLGFIFLNETLNWLMLPAVVCILTGLYMVSSGKQVQK